MTGPGGPRRYAVRHRTTYTYDEPVTSSFGRGFLRPRPTPTQRVLAHDVRVTPTPAVLEEHLDFFGNPSSYLEIHTDHERLELLKTTTVDVDWPEVSLAGLDAWTVGSAAAAVASSSDPVVRAVYRLPSELVELTRPVRAFAGGVVPSARPLGDAVQAVYHDIFTGFAYAKGATTVTTRLGELLASRAGVCQDFAHLAVACFRSAGLPARYVSGYIETAPPPGKPKLEGSDATHAWASVLTPLGWVDLDPTNDHLADSRYIVTAWGRDFRDVSPLKGVIFTDGSTSTLAVSVDVTRLPDPDPHDASAP